MHGASGLHQKIAALVNLLHLSLVYGCCMWLLARLDHITMLRHAGPAVRANILSRSIAI
jgi:hypothetical protein